MTNIFFQNKKTDLFISALAKINDDFLNVSHTKHKYLVLLTNKAYIVNMKQLQVSFITDLSAST